MTQNKGDYRIDLITGTADQRSVGLQAGVVIEPFALGTTGAWRIASPGMAGIHAYLYFDGQTAFIAAASPKFTTVASGKRVGTQWMALTAPSTITLGSARLRFDLNDGSDFDDDGSGVTRAIDISRKAQQLGIAYNARPSPGDHEISGPPPPPPRSNKQPAIMDSSDTEIGVYVGPTETLDSDQPAYVTTVNAAVVPDFTQEDDGEDDDQAKTLAGPREQLASEASRPMQRSQRPPAPERPAFDSEPTRLQPVGNPVRPDAAFRPVSPMVRRQADDEPTRLRSVAIATSSQSSHPVPAPRQRLASQPAYETSLPIQEPSSPVPFRADRTPGPSARRVSSAQLGPRDPSAPTAMPSGVLTACTTPVGRSSCVTGLEEAAQRALATQRTLPPSRPSSRASAPATQAWRGLRRVFHEASTIQKIILALMPLAFVAVFFAFRDRPAPQQSNPSPALSANQGPLGAIARPAVSPSAPSPSTFSAGAPQPNQSASAAPTAETAAAISLGSLPIVAPDAASSNASAATVASAPGAKPLNRSLEKAAADAVAAGAYADAVKLYEQLAADHPDKPVFKEAARILRLRADSAP